MNFQKPIFTDSGGFQVFSLGSGLEQGVGKIGNIFPGEEEKKIKPKEKSKVKITEEGVIFYSHLDGSEKFFSPEISIRVQEYLGSDFVFTFDECTSPLDSYEYVKEATERTHRWAIRSLKAFKGKNQAIYGIVQGSYFKDLRIKSARFINSLDFFGIGIGGSLGKTKKDMYKILSWIMPILDENKPRHLLGIGTIEDIEKIIKFGIDTFDCVAPTRLARHGTAILKKGYLNLKSARYRNSKEPIDKNCKCYTCQNFSRGYLRHLILAKEITGTILLAYHNLWVIERILEEIREKIKKGKL
jgi:queuine tRNA-ribosyltransferase/7-cyano-7-deazaguanine tRNA-ribosyltransferase